MRSATNKIMQKFGGQRRIRPWRVSHFGGMQAAQLHPLAACRFRPDEGGTVSTTLNVNLAPVSGYMRSNAYCEVIQIFVPYQAIEKLELPTTPDAGVTEMSRRRLLAGTGVGLEPAGQISNAAYVHGRTIDGETKVQKSVRLAYIAAVNYLRRQRYHAADELPHDHTAIAPAVLTATVLDRFNGVLDPEKLIDGAINLTGDLPVKGIGKRWTGQLVAGNNLDVPVVETYEARGNHFVRNYPEAATTHTSDDTDGIIVELESGRPKIYAEASTAGELSLRDLIQSKKLDQLMRIFAGMIEDDPEHGEEKVARALYGLSVDYDDDPVVVYHRNYELTPAHQRPTDGASINDVSAHFALQDTFATVVPKSELGGQLLTLVAVKPLEVLGDQPDPAQTEAWQVVNRVHDETELDEKLLKRSDLETGVAPENADQPVFWVGHNQLAHDYDTKGVNEQQVLGVQVKSSMWLYKVPSSVTPSNVNYPDSVDMYPFYHWNGPAAEYTIQQVAAISTSLAKGPNPVEKIQLFADDPTLVNKEL